MSERSGKVLLGLALLLTGGFVLMDLIGIDAGDFLGVLIPGLIMLYGARKVMGSSGSRFWGILVFLFGLLMLIGKLHLLFNIALAIGVIYLGYRFIRRKDKTDDSMPAAWERQWARQVLKEDALDSWEHRVTRKQQP
ncbi:LiaF transmembrane domain-containing protein [Brevibacillus borstelensis]|uniref:LiaF transmembrane domain-containing protein n=1 Tax=Brevibacillus borstelensis TaxID=45462 RepID=UPI0030C25955